MSDVGKAWCGKMGWADAVRSVKGNTVSSLASEALGVGVVLAAEFIG